MTIHEKFIASEAYHQLSELPKDVPWTFDGFWCVWSVFLQELIPICQEPKHEPSQEQ